MESFAERKAAMIRDCEGVLKDIEILKPRILELKELLESGKINSVEDALKYYPNDIDLEDDLEYISL